MKRETPDDESVATPRRPQLQAPSRDADDVTMISRLPVPLVREQIFSFVAAPFDALHEDSPVVQYYIGELAPLRKVCRQWQKEVEDMASTARRRVQSLHFKTASASELLATQRRATQNGPHAQGLEIISSVLHQPDYLLHLCRRHPSMNVPKLMAAPWNKLLQNFRNIVRLDLSMMTPFRLLSTVLTAATTKCPHVHALILPFQPDPVQEQVKLRDVSTPLTQALSQWHDHNGGLRLLHVPWWPLDGQGQYNDLLSAVAAYCPELQSLRGYHMNSREGEIAMLGNVSDRVWAAFCDQCTKLESFDWSMALTTKHAFSAFSLKPKRQLRRLLIHEFSKDAVPPFSQLSLLRPLVSSPFPQLRSFYLDLQEFRSPVRGDGMTGDELALLVAQNCLVLEQFSYQIREQDDECRMTSVGIVALTKLQFMNHLEVKKASLQDNGLVALVRLERHCKLLLRLSVVKGSSHVPILNLLQFLQEQDPTDFVMGRTLELCVWTESGIFHSRVLEEADRDTMVDHTQLQAMVESLLVLYDTQPMRLSVTARQYSYQDSIREKRYKSTLSSMRLVLNTGETIDPKSQAFSAVARIHTDDCGRFPA